MPRLIEIMKLQIQFLLKEQNTKKTPKLICHILCARKCNDSDFFQATIVHHVCTLVIRDINQTVAVPLILDGLYRCIFFSSVVSFCRALYKSSRS